MNSNEEKYCDIEKEQSVNAGNLPVTGLNDNLEFFGRQLHVQTENLEVPVARIVTQVFCKGRVLFSRKSECPPDIREAGDTHKIHELMQAQHFQILKEIADKQAKILSSH
jgi:hypothetical protein